MPAGPVGDASAAHVLGRLAVVEERVRELIAHRRRDDPQPDDPFRGLYLSDETVERLLTGPAAEPVSTLVGARTTACEQAADLAEAAGERLRLRELARDFALQPLDVELLLVALACEVDARFEQLFGYLNDDVTRRRPSAAVALALCGVPLASSQGRHRLEHGPLVSAGLLELEEPSRPLPRPPPRVAGPGGGHPPRGGARDRPLHRGPAAGRPAARAGRGGGPPAGGRRARPPARRRPRRRRRRAVGGPDQARDGPGGGRPPGLPARAPDRLRTGARRGCAARGRPGLGRA